MVRLNLVGDFIPLLIRVAIPLLEAVEVLAVEDVLILVMTVIVGLLGLIGGDGLLSVNFNC